MSVRAYKARALDAPAAVRPVEVIGEPHDVDVARTGAPYRSALLVAMAAGRPLGTALVDTGGTAVVPADVARHALSAAIALPQHLPVSDGIVPLPTVSVVVTTCAASADALTTVASVLACRPAPVEVIVVENRPSRSDVSRALTTRFPGDPRVRYVEESRQGLSWARNAGLAVARGDIVAFTDDDVRVAEGWIRWIQHAFASESSAACVTGLIMPAELETRAQVLLEQYAGFGKGFARRVFRASEPTSRLFPYAAGEFGSGANTAVRADVARTLGGFDAALGAGTPACGAEDLDLYVRLLLAGHAIVYEPGALLWHRHPDTAARLRREAFRYGLSLSAMLAKLALTGHGRAIAARVWAGLRFLRDPTSRKNERKGTSYPWTLDLWEYSGMLLGPLAYLVSRRRTARVRVATR